MAKRVTLSYMNTQAFVLGRYPLADIVRNAGIYTTTRTSPSSSVLLSSRKYKFFTLVLRKLHDSSKVATSEVIEGRGDTRVLDALRRTRRAGSEATSAVRAGGFIDEDLDALHARQRLYVSTSAGVMCMITWGASCPSVLTIRRSLVHNIGRSIVTPTHGVIAPWYWSQMVLLDKVLDLHLFTIYLGLHLAKSIREYDG